MINITKTLEKLDELGLSTRFHTARHPLPVQRKRIEEYCREANVEPAKTAIENDPARWDAPSGLQCRRETAGPNRG